MDCQCIGEAVRYRGIKEGDGIRMKDPNRFGSSGQPAIIREDMLTYDDYAKLPEGARYELIDGVLHSMLPAPTFRHQDLCRALVLTLSASCSQDYVIVFAPIDLIVPPYQALQPDVVLISRDRLDIITPRGIEGVPDLVVEILSPGTTHRDTGRKMNIYAEIGVQEVWLIDPDQVQLHQHANTGGVLERIATHTHDTQIRTPRIPCVTFTMNAIAAQLVSFVAES
jgi:Uma2 family endonuclease